MGRPAPSRPQKEARRDLTEMARRIALSTASQASDAPGDDAADLSAAAAHAAAAADAGRPALGDDAPMETGAASTSQAQDDSAAQHSRRQGRHGEGTAASFRNQLMLPEWCGEARFAAPRGVIHSSPYLFFLHRPSPHDGRTCCHDPVRPEG